MTYYENENISTISGTVESVTFYNPDNGFIIFSVETEDEIETIVGELGIISVGEDVIVTGKYVDNVRFGKQFSAFSCEKKLPTKSDNIYKYLASGVIKGISEGFAKEIVDNFGDKSFEIIESSPEELVKIKGFTHKKATEVSREFKKISGIKSLISFVAEHNFKPQIAISAWKKWGADALTVINENPFELCGYGVELGFSDAESLADSLEISKNSDIRITAGIIFILQENINAGHSCLPVDRLTEMAVNKLNVSAEDVELSIQNGCKDETFDTYDKNGRKYIFLYEYSRAENYISTRINILNEFPVDESYDYNVLIELEESTKSVKYADLQWKAIYTALAKGFLILTGGPGTGKTTTLEAIISLYEQQGMNVLIAAPTGKAAKRISELTGYNAKTIHRLLEVGFNEYGKAVFKHNEDDPLDCDVIIIDEMSMVDTLLFEALLRALSLSCRVILVGDSHQLPSVGAGNVLKDLLETEKLTVIELTEIFRQAALSSIVTNAHKIIRGEHFNLFENNKDFFFMQKCDLNAASELVTNLISTRLPNAYDFSPLDDIQVLCPSRKSITGTINLNKAIQKEINPPKGNQPFVKNLLYSFYVNDKVIQTKNNYDVLWKKGSEEGTGIFNGDIGIIKGISKINNTLTIDFDGRVVNCDFEMIKTLELAYAITVHKSQGSEFDAVILPLLGGYTKLYYRNLLYTAVTRAKKILVIVGSSEVVEEMIDNDNRSLRYSCLKHRVLSNNFDEVLPYDEE